MTRIHADLHGEEKTANIRAIRVILVQFFDLKEEAGYDWRVRGFWVMEWMDELRIA